MSSLTFGPNDRDANGKLRIEARTFTDALPPLDKPAPQPVKVAGRVQMAVGVVVCVFAVLAVVFMAQRVPSAEAPRTLPSAVPTSAPTIATQPSVQPAHGLPHAVVAYAAPGGVVLGSIEAGRAYTVTARIDMDWTQIKAEGSGLVWVAARELAPDSTLPNLATPTPRPAPVVPQQPVYYNDAPLPTRCASVSGGGTIVERCGVESIDVLDAQAQQEWRERFGVATPVR